MSEVIPKRSIVFTHIERTAGSTIHAAFRCDEPRRWLVVDGKARLRDAPLAQPCYIGGHFSLSDVSNLTGLDITTTVNFATVREPVARILSLYAYIRKNRVEYPALWNSLWNERDDSVESFIEAVLERRPEYIRNAQCGRFAAQATFRAARNVIRTRYAFVATTDRLPDLVAYVAKDARRTPPALPPPQNAVGFDGDPSPITRLLLEELTREDAKLYNFVQNSHGGLWVRAATLASGELRQYTPEG